MMKLTITPKQVCEKNKIYKRLEYNDKETMKKGIKIQIRKKVQKNKYGAKYTRGVKVTKNDKVTQKSNVLTLCHRHRNN